MEKSIKAREYSKFIFTKSINIILEKIKQFSRNLKISLFDMEYLTIKEIISAQNFQKQNHE